MSEGPAIDAGRVLTDLDALAELTADENGAQRLCWTAEWRTARDFLRSRLAEIGIDAVEEDEAGNLWARLPGIDRRSPALAVGSHLDSVPAGGPLDGALGVMAGLGVLRAWAESGAAPPRDLVLIDFADEEGARFGRSLFGSSALAGTLVPDELQDLTDADGNGIADVLAGCGVELAHAPEAHRRLGEIGTYLELHIEQGPVLESEGTACSAVSGCAGVERHMMSFHGQASHAGTTPMDHRRDAGLAAAEVAIEVERIATHRGGVGTTGVLNLEPGIVTAVAGSAELNLDLRHPEAGSLAEMLADVRAAAAAIAERRGCGFDEHAIWRIEPIPFDHGLVELAAGAAAAVGGREVAMVSGALHDAAEIARVRPTAMIFAASVGGVSHAKEEQSTDAALTGAVAAFSRLVSAVLTGQ